jgi:hypothetical protein
MNKVNLVLSPHTEADLKKLVEPLASYIAAVSQPRVGLVVALILLLDNLREIHDDANQYLSSVSENHVG